MTREMTEGALPTSARNLDHRNDGIKRQGDVATKSASPPSTVGQGTTPQNPELGLGNIENPAKSSVRAVVCRRVSTGGARLGMGFEIFDLSRF